MGNLEATTNPPVRIVADEIEKTKALPAGSRTVTGEDAGSYLVFTMIVFAVDGAGGHMSDIAGTMASRIADQFNTNVSVTAIDLNDGTIAAGWVGFDFYNMQGTKNFYKITLPSGTLA